MRVALEECPTEIIGILVGHLDLPDVCNLRLASRCLWSKITQREFRASFQSKTVKIIGSELENFAHVTQRGWLGCEITHLTLVGVVNNTERLEEAVRTRDNQDDQQGKDLETLRQRQREYEQLRDSGKLLHTLGTAFKNIIANSPTGKLTSLSLELVVYLHNARDELAPIAGGDLRPIWQMAAKTHRLVFAALKDSGLEIGALKIFSRAGLHRCSIAGNELSEIDYAAEGLAIPLRSLESLSVSVSPYLFDLLSPYKTTRQEHEQSRQKARKQVSDERNFTGLANLIQACGNRKLRHLDLHYQRANEMSVRVPNQRLFQRIAALGNTLPKLEDCCLRGVFLTEADLLAFLRSLSSSLRRFEMETVTMTHGTFTSIFELLTATNGSTSTDADTAITDPNTTISPFPSLQYLYLDTLIVGGYLVYFMGAGEPRFPVHHWQRGDGGNVLSRQGEEEIKRHIAYHVPTNFYPYGSQPHSEWLHQRETRYGPG